MRISDWSSDVCSSDLSAAWRTPLKRRAILARSRCKIARRSATIQVSWLMDAKRRSDLVRPPASLRPRCPATAQSLDQGHEIGRASCRERVCQDVKISGVAVYLKKKNTKKDRAQ